MKKRQLLNDSVMQNMCNFGIIKCNIMAIWLEI